MKFNFKAFLLYTVTAIFLVMSALFISDLIHKRPDGGTVSTIIDSDFEDITYARSYLFENENILTCYDACNKNMGPIIELDDDDTRAKYSSEYAYFRTILDDSIEYYKTDDKEVNTDTGIGFCLYDRNGLLKSVVYSYILDNKQCLAISTQSNTYYVYKVKAP